MLDKKKKSNMRGILITDFFACKGVFIIYVEPGVGELFSNPKKLHDPTSWSK